MLEEKLDTLTKEIVALRKSIEANGTGAASPTTAAKAKAKAKVEEDDDDDDADEVPAKGKTKAPAKGKAKAPEPDHDEDEVGSIMRKAAKIDKPAVQKYIKKVKCADLAELLTKPTLFDAAFDFADAIVNAPDDDDDDDDDDV